MNSHIIYGMNAVTETLKQHPEKGATLLLARDSAKSRTGKLAGLAEAKGIPVQPCSRQELEKLVPPGTNHQGVVLKLREVQRSAAPFNEADFWQDRIRAAMEAGQKPLVAILDQIQDPGNLGAIIRSAAQFGINELFIPKKNAADVTPAALKAACGGENHIHVNRETNLSRTLEELQELGIWSGAAAAGPQALPLWQADLNRAFCFILGSEGKGIRPLLAGKADYQIAIPTLERLDSLNVSVAAGILFYEAYRQQHS